MRILAGVAGSRGDVQPVIEIASALARRGHEVRIFVPAQFQRIAIERGLTVSCFKTDSTQLMQSLGAGMKSALQALTWARDAMLEQLEVLIPATEGADALLTAVNELGAPTVAEHRGIPHFRVTYVPALPGDQPPPLTPIQGTPVLVNRALWGGLDIVTKLIFGGPLGHARRRLGLPPLRKFSEYSAGSSHTLLAMDPVLSPPVRGWQYEYDYVGYPFGGDTGALSPDLEAFLAAGPAPVYLGFGSVMVPNPMALARLMAKAIARVGCRAIIGQGWAGLGQGADLPRGVRLLGAAPHRTLFPRMAGVVHHGGAGTTHSAARAGVPQAILPQIIDQYYWGRRMHDMGLGPRPVPLARLTEGKLVAILQELLQPERARQARVVGSLMREDGAEVAAELIERHLAKRSGAVAEPPRQRIAHAPQIAALT